MLTNNILDMSKNELTLLVGEQAKICSVEIGYDRNKLEKVWYASNCSDYSIYGSPDYISELLYCWFNYSKGYVKNLIKLNLFPSNPKKILDLGCGIGLTTIALKQTFPNAEVLGTNISGTPQFKLCKHFSEKYGFSVIEDFEDVGKCDFVFASEYFEHIQNPIDHLFSLIKHTQPNFVYTANSFNAYASGHFDRYIVADEEVEAKKLGRIFGSEMRLHGYKKMDANLWNNRPTCWEYLYES